MKRKLSFLVLSLALVCACSMLSGCLFMAGQQGNKDKELDAPTGIVIEDVTENSIFIFDVIYGEEGGGETEISIDGADWIDFDNSVGYTFDNLTPNTEYTVYARQKGYGDYEASDVFSRKVTTLRSASTRVPANVTATIYHGTVTLNGLTDEMEISYDNGKTYTGDKTYKYNEKGEKTILVRYKETADYLAGENITLKVKYNDFAGGSGTAADPYLIEDFDQFRAINTEHIEGIFFKLLDDIQFPATPVTDIIVFSGTFDGNNKKLIAPRFDYTKLSGESIINAYGGIFHTNGHDTVIRNLTVEDAEITTNASCTMPAHGLLINHAKELTNCNVSGKITVACLMYNTYWVGGLCGEITDSGSAITNCRADVTVETVTSELVISGVNAGGLVGKISADCTIESSSAKITALINSTKFFNGYVGGLVGLVEKAEKVTISKCHAENDVNLLSTKCFVGGLVAYAPNTDITNCYATGNITAIGDNGNSGSFCTVGGITAGVEADSKASTGSITNCYSAVNFTLDRRQSNITASGITCNAIGTADKVIQNCLYVGNITVDGYGHTVDISAVVVNASEYTLTNNYVATSSTEGMNTEGATTVSVSDYYTRAWWKDTLGFDEAVWMLYSGKLPELK